MTDNIVKLVPPEVGDKYRLEARDILIAASEQDFERVAIIGRLEDGELYVAGTANAGETMILLEQAKHFIAFGHDGREDA